MIYRIRKLLCHSSLTFFANFHTMAVSGINAEPFSVDSVPTLLLLGDSLTQYCWSSNGGWGSILADKLQRRCDIISRGMSGYNTRMYRSYLPTILKPFVNTSVCGFVILLGANDAADQSLNAHQHVPLLEYEDNLVATARFLQKYFPEVKSNNILMVSPPPVDEEMRQQHCISQHSVLDRFNHVTECYAKATQSAAERAGVMFVDFFNEAAKAGAARSLSDKGKAAAIAFFTDGLHLNIDGAQLLASLLWPHLNRMTRGMQSFLPYWRDIDPNAMSFDEDDD